MCSPSLSSTDVQTVISRCIHPVFKVESLTALAARATLLFLEAEVATMVGLILIDAPLLRPLRRKHFKVLQGQINAVIQGQQSGRVRQILLRMIISGLLPLSSRHTKKQPKEKGKSCSHPCCTGAYFVEVMMALLLNEDVEEVIFPHNIPELVLKKKEISDLTGFDVTSILLRYIDQLVKSRKLPALRTLIIQTQATHAFNQLMELESAKRDHIIRFLTFSKKFSSDHKSPPDVLHQEAALAKLFNLPTIFHQLTTIAFHGDVLNRDGLQHVTKLFSGIARSCPCLEELDLTKVLHLEPAHLIHLIFKDVSTYGRLTTNSKKDLPPPILDDRIFEALYAEEATTLLLEGSIRITDLVKAVSINDNTADLCQTLKRLLLPSGMASSALISLLALQACPVLQSLGRTEMDEILLSIVDLNLQEKMNLPLAITEATIERCCWSSYYLTSYVLSVEATMNEEGKEKNVILAMTKDDDAKAISWGSRLHKLVETCPSITNLTLSIPRHEKEDSLIPLYDLTKLNAVRMYDTEWDEVETVLRAVGSKLSRIALDFSLFGEMHEEKYHLMPTLQHILLLCPSLEEIQVCVQGVLPLLPPVAQGPSLTSLVKVKIESNVNLATFQYLWEQAKNLQELVIDGGIREASGKEVVLTENRAEYLGLVNRMPHLQVLTIALTFSCLCAARIFISNLPTMTTIDKITIMVSMPEKYLIKSLESLLHSTVVNIARFHNMCLQREGKVKVKWIKEGLLHHLIEQYHLNDLLPMNDTEL